MSRRELLLGSGARRIKALRIDEMPAEFENLTTLDVMPEHKPDVVHDLTKLPLPFDDCSFDEIHAYEVLEHCGQQGDWRLFFGQFNEFHRILKPNGVFCASVPMWDNEWAWADPGHQRIIAPKTIAFLDRDFYAQVGRTNCTDYRGVYTGNFRVVAQQEKDFQYFFILRAVK